jgi:hypothetical protein
MTKDEGHTWILCIATLEGVGRVSIWGSELVLPWWSWRIDGMVAGWMQPSPIHKRPFLLPCPASTATSGSKGTLRGSTSVPCTSPNFLQYSVYRSSDPSLTHIDPLRSGSGSSRVRVLFQTVKKLGSTFVSLLCKRKHEDTCRVTHWMRREQFDEQEWRMHLLTSFWIWPARERLPWRWHPRWPISAFRFTPLSCFFLNSLLVQYRTIDSKTSLLANPTYWGGTCVHNTNILMKLDGGHQINNTKMKLPEGTATAPW